MTASEIRRRLLFGAGPGLPRPPKPYDHMTKATMWAEIERLRAQRTAAARLATVARNSIVTEGTEGSPTYRALSSAREQLRGLCAALEDC